MNKVLSVSIAAYNVAPYIDDTLAPFTRINGLERLEVLIIDDGSKDETTKIVREYQTRYPDVFRLVTKENGGWGSTVNRGLLLASGKYFKLLDGDDYYDDKSLSLLLDWLEKTEEDLVLTPYCSFYDGEGINVYKGNSVFQDYNLKIVDMSAFPKGPFCFEMYSITVKTDIIKGKIHITENSFYTDNEFSYKVCILCNSVKILNTPVYCYRVGRVGQSVSIEGFKKHFKEFDAVLSSLVKSLNTVDNNRLKEIFIDRYVRKSYYYMEMLIKMIYAGDKNKLVYLKSFDSMLKEENPVIYRRINYTLIHLLRFFDYHFAVPIIRIWFLKRNICYRGTSCL